MLNIPNALTFFRILLIPVLAALYLLPLAWSNTAVTAVFLAAGLSDWLDGYLARRLKQDSKFGAFLDPVADKLIVVTALVLLVSDEAVMSRVLSQTVFALVVAIIIGRELVVSALREWMAELGNRAQVSVSLVGKIKTAGQFVAIAMMLYRESVVDVSMLRLGEALLVLAAGLTLWSMVMYLRAAWAGFVREQ